MGAHLAQVEREVQTHSFPAVGTWRPRTAPEVLFQYTVQGSARARPQGIAVHCSVSSQTSHWENIAQPTFSCMVLASRTGGAVFLPLRCPASCLFHIWAIALRLAKNAEVFCRS